MRDRNKNDHCTPVWILDALRDAYRPIGLDPCWNQWAKTEPQWRMDGSEKGCGLTDSWDVTLNGGFIFMNPPFARGVIDRWAERWAMYARRGFPLVALTQLETRTAWSKTICDAAQYRIDINGYVRFDGAKSGGAMHSHVLHVANMHGRVKHERFRVWGRM